MRLNKPSPRLAILRAQLAAEADSIRLQRASYKISNAVGCSCPVPAPDADSLPLPPDYWSDLEHWLKTLAPAKPAEVKPAPSDAWAPAIGDRIMINEGVDCAVFFFPGDTGIIIGIDHDFDLKVKFDASSKAEVSDFWYVNPKNARLASTSSADVAALVVEKLKHSVCIRTHGVWKAGEVTCWHTAKPGDPDNWLPCDKDGWIPHEPTPYSTCPVPDGVEFAAMWASGEESKISSDYFRTAPTAWKSTNVNRGLRAWRPIADSSK